MLDRRTLLRGALGAGVVWPLWSAGCAVDDELPAGLVVSAADRVGGGHFLSVLDLRAGLAFEREVSQRGHAAAVHPRRAHAVLVARRPGTELHVVDLVTGELVTHVTSPARRHFLGHAVYSADGTRLYATENDFDDAVLPDLTPRESVIGIYDVEGGYQRIGEHAAGGVGAHALLLLTDGTLAVAIGGIYTHPGRPREDLNIDTMDPSLVRLDADSGTVIEQVRLDLGHPRTHQLGLRHLAATTDGALVVGIQYVGPPADDVPLVALQHTGQPLQPLATPDDVRAALDHYISSVAIHEPAGRIVAASSRGGLLAFWDTSGAFLGTHPATDVSGVGTIDDAIIASTGTGSVLVIDADALTVRRELRLPEVRWDNHLTTVAPG